MAIVKVECHERIVLLEEGPSGGGIGQPVRVWKNRHGTLNIMEDARGRRLAIAIEQGKAEWRSVAYNDKRFEKGWREIRGRNCPFKVTVLGDDIVSTKFTDIIQAPLQFNQRWPLAGLDIAPKRPWFDVFTQNILTRDDDEHVRIVAHLTPEVRSIEGEPNTLSVQYTVKRALAVDHGKVLVWGEAGTLSRADLFVKFPDVYWLWEWVVYNEDLSLASYRKLVEYSKKKVSE